MIKNLLIFIITLLFATSTQIYAADNITIAANGKSTFTIVLPQQRHSALNDAALEMQKDIFLATHARLDIKNDIEINEQTKNFISLGDTKQAQATGITSEGIADGGFQIITKAGNVYIIGPDTPSGGYTKEGGTGTGSANGVYTFLENYLNVRWLMPGNLGRDVPHVTSFVVPKINYREVPAWNWRQLPYIQEDLDSVKLWEEQQKLRYYSMNMDYQHSWSKVVPTSMYKDHPDWFALTDGSRRPKGSDYKLETTNPELVHYFAEQAIAKLKTNPHLFTASLSPTDGRSWSESPESKALYDPVPPGSQYPSVTPLVLKFYNDVSQIVAKEYPGGKLAGYIYASYLYPPQKGLMKLPDNFIPVFAASPDYGFKLYQKNHRETIAMLMDDWSKVVPHDWYFYDLPNVWWVASNSPYQIGSTGLITPPGIEILDSLFPQLVKNHFRGARIYGTESWSNAAMTNYILAKLMWNPRLNASALEKEWLTRAYGPQAGKLMEQFYQKLEDAFESYSQEDAINWKLEDQYLQGIYATHYPELEALLLQAKATPMTPLQKERFELIENNFIILQWRLRNMGYLKSTFTSPLQRSDAEVAAIIQKKSNGFSYFPVIPKTQERKIPKLTVSAAQDAMPKNPKKPPYFGMTDTFLFYAAKDGEFNINCSQVSQGSFFAYYQVRTTTASAVLASGMLYKNASITIPVKGGTAYYLTIPSNAGISYQIDIENATIVNGDMQKDTFHLYGKPAPIWLLSASSSSVATSQSSTGTSVTITKSLPNAGTVALGKIQLQNMYQNIQVNQVLDDKWFFQPDAKNSGMQSGFTHFDFDDSSWKVLPATDWWQNQGFAGFHGTAWYRKKFTAPKLQNKQQAILYFGAIDGNADIYLNGQQIQEHRVGTKADNFSGWDQPVMINITPYLQPGENVIAAQVTSKEVGSSGIYKGAALFVAEIK